MGKQRTSPDFWSVSYFPVLDFILFRFVLFYFIRSSYCRGGGFPSMSPRNPAADRCHLRELFMGTRDFECMGFVRWSGRLLEDGVVESVPFSLRNPRLAIDCGDEHSVRGHGWGQADPCQKPVADAPTQEGCLVDGKNTIFSTSPPLPLGGAEVLAP